MRRLRLDQASMFPVLARAPMTCALLSAWGASAQVQIALNNTTLSVTGTATADVVLIVPRGPAILVLTQDGQNNLAFAMTAAAFVTDLFIDANAGDDRIVVLADIKSEIRAGAGNDEGPSKAKKSLEFPLTGKPPGLMLSLGAGNDQVTVRGTFAAIVVDAAAGNDSVRIRESDCPVNVLLGGEGKDIIESGSNPSLILGEEGDDTIVSGSERDWISGGAGRNRVRSNQALVTEHFNPAGLKLLRRGGQ